MTTDGDRGNHVVCCDRGEHGIVVGIIRAVKDVIVVIVLYVVIVVLLEEHARAGYLW